MPATEEMRSICERRLSACRHSAIFIFAIAFGDLKESLRYMCREQPVIVQLSLAAAAINLILSALVMIGLPVIITQMLELDGETSNRLYGYAESVFAMGSLCGGAGADLFAKRIKAKHGYLLLLYDGLTLIPIGQAIYGGLFEVLGKRIFLLFFAAMLLTGMLALLLKRIFQKLEALLE